MRALVVYESMYGNTRDVAEAVAQGLRDHDLLAEVVEVGHAPTALTDEVDLLVVGAPTHAFGLSRPSTREDAGEKAHREVISAGIGVREWLARLPQGVVPQAATFATRVAKPRVPGSAARKAAKLVDRLGARQAIVPEDFWVHDLQGPLLEGELDRARGWGGALATAAQAAGRRAAPS